MRMSRRWAAFTVIAAMLFCLAPAAPVLAAKSDEDEIGSVSLVVEADIKAGSSASNLTVRKSGSADTYDVESYDFDSPSGDWEPGDIPRVKVTLSAASDCRFKRTIGTGNVKVKGGTCTAAKRTNDGYSLEVTIRLKGVEGQLGAVSDAYWADSPLGKAKWDEAEYAGAYEVRLYKGSKLLKKVEKTTTTSYNFFPFMTTAGDYVFWVRPVPRNSSEADYLEKGEWEISDTLTIRSSEVSSGNEGSQISSPTGGGNQTPADTTGPGVTMPEIPVSGGGWKQDYAGWWYELPDGKWPSNCWQFIDGKWYYFNGQGYIETGWFRDRAKTYYLDNNGAMVTGWMEYDRQWYYFGDDGSMRTGWTAVDGLWYYFNSNGTMAQGWLADGKDWYYLDPAQKGAMAVSRMIGDKYVDQTGRWVQ